MRILILLLSCLIINQTQASDIKYRVAEIPASLLPGADVVKRMEKTEFIILNTGATILRRQYAVTILNENGDDYSGIEIFYDQLQKVISIEGALYNENGMLLKKLKTKDITDASAGSSMNLMEDNRVKSHNFYYKNYPYTVEYTVETNFNNTYFFPSWVPQENDRYSVEQSSYKIVFPKEYQVRFKEFNYKNTPIKIEENGKSTMTWEIKNVPAFKAPFACFTWKELVPMVYFAPSEFEIEGYKGNMQTWQDLGRFQVALNKGRDVLPENIQQKVKELTENLPDKKQKIVALYEYFQKNTRYISVQLGLGGWQPFDATYVSKNGYGDCKALTNYMHSLLKAANITSNYTIVNAGGSASAKNRVIADFPSVQFNHVILCVPLEKDSMWLECTSQELPAGYMSDFTANRKALLITEDGGVLVSTPRYGINQNQQIRTIHAQLSEDGDLKIKSNTTLEGVQQDEVSSLVRNLSTEKIKKYLEKNLPLTTYEVNNFTYKENRSEMPSIVEDLDITVNNYASVSGKRIFIVPNIFNRGGYQYIEDTARKVDIEFKLEYRDKDEVVIEIPEGYEIEARPKDIFLKTKYGNYMVSSSLKGNQIIYYRLFEQFSGRFPASEQTAVIDFYKTIFKTDRTKIVLVKKGE
ncbi:MAG: DUF3857 domain-containing protein [Ginsengibacter sp.]|jgi:hypothetical protein